MTAPIILLPPSEGKAPGGRGAPWRDAKHEFTDLDGFDRGEGAPECTCAQGPACRHVRTIRHGNRADSTPYQDDWLFVSKSLEHQVSAGRVVHDEAAWQRSDHCPLVLDLDL